MEQPDAAHDLTARIDAIHASFRNILFVGALTLLSGYVGGGGLGWALAGGRPAVTLALAATNIALGIIGVIVVNRHRLKAIPDERLQRGAWWAAISAPFVLAAIALVTSLLA